MSEPSHDDDLSHFSVEHRARRLDSRAAPPKPPPPKRRIVWEVVLLGGIVALGALLSPFSDLATPEYPEARAQADRLSAAYQSVSRGGVSPRDAATAGGLDMYEFEVVGDGGTVSVLTHPEPTAEGTCYALRMGGGIATLAAKFAPTDGCVPQGRAAFEMMGSWDDVLPSERMTTVWFVPVLLILVGIGVAIVTNIVLKLLPR